ncbi:class I adenylate-forming enzyme family protein [uncultured Williamsia sp.]|uniref:class I adenylate-forming enzyme family protein n=1 Tax=uncultured Williamsia sp. TaxID=259311 RepID=UPI00262B5985|nr:fatty acid--CoA ligase family protein [uncultured Williamsia sp.]
MSISVLLEMAVSADDERTAVVCDDVRLTTRRLDHLASGAAGLIASTGARHVVYVGVGGVMSPLGIFGSARAGVPFTPINYRLAAEAVRTLVDRLDDPLVVADSRYLESLQGSARTVMSTDEFLSRAQDHPHHDAMPGDEDVAVVLFTSGTTSAPKAVQLTHRNLTSYIIGTVEFASADPRDAALICVPPYHIAGVGAAMSNLYAGRTMVYLTAFDARRWLSTVVDEGVTSATVVPTMLDRIVAELRRRPVELPTLRTLAYGGSKASLPLVRAAMDLLPGVGFVNAYGLTETSSTIAVLTDADHREAHGHHDAGVAARLASVGRPVDGIEVAIRTEDGSWAAAGEPGRLFVRGDQVSGRYADVGSVLDADGWFDTGDNAHLDDAGYLFIVGRADDTIIRGGENIAPAEVEDVIAEFPGVREVAVVGLPDEEWGQALVAAVVGEDGVDIDPAAVRAHVRQRLHGSRTPDRVVVLDELPVTATGKVLRRQIVEDLAVATADASAGTGTR